MFMTTERLVQDLTQIIIRLEKALEVISEGDSQDDKTYRQAISFIAMCGDTLSSFPKLEYETAREKHLYSALISASFVNAEALGGNNMEGNQND